MTGGRGFEVVRIAGGLRIQTHPDLAPYVERFANVGVSSRLSAAALETLAIVAYKQPVSRAQVAALRGVNVDGVVRLLEHRGYITPVGRATGRARPSSTPPPTPSWSASASTVSTSSRRWRTCCPGPRPWPSSRSRCARSPMPEGGPDDVSDTSPGPAGDLAPPGRAAAEGAGPDRGRLPPGVRGPHRRRTGHRQRRGARARPPGRHRRRPDRARRRAPAGAPGPGPLPGQQAGRRGLDGGGHPRSAHGGGPGARPSPGSTRSGGSTWTPRASSS